MRIYDIIAKKRDGGSLEEDEIKFFIDEYCKNNIPDYQAAALLMAIFLKGMNHKEIANLTKTMAYSGDMLDLSLIKGVKIDKHSTGGVGDKTTLILAPIVASFGIPVAKMSGKGLGHTGGTIDKLDSIPGFRTSLTRDEFISNVNKIGISISGQTGNFAPADKKLYALRDATATVNSIPLIASSVMSKKIAAGADKIVLDVKVGSGAFMKNIDDAKELANIMVEIGNRLGRKVVAIITNMDIPLGNAIGNALEVIESIETLKGNGPQDLKEVSFELAAIMLELAGIGSLEYCREKVEESIYSKKALTKFREMIVAQGGNGDIIDNYDLFKQPKMKYEFKATMSGYLNHVETEKLGIASMILGAGRKAKEDDIDYSAGIELKKKPGDKVNSGDILAVLYSDYNEKIQDCVEVLYNIFQISQLQIVEKGSFILEKIQ